MRFASGAYLTKPVDRDKLLDLLGAYRRAERPTTVLVVEDDENLRQAIRAILEARGGTVQEAANGRLALLYVEDNDDNLYMLTLRFEALGDYEIISAVDGAEGIAKAAAEQPDLILMDLNLPGVDGWKATRQLKASAAMRDIPIIALTAHAMAGEREEALAAGSDDFDTKPIEFDRLLAKVNGLLARK